MVDDNNNRRIRIEDLYPGQTAEWYAEAETNLKAYVAIIWRIHQRLKAQGKKWPELDK